MVDAAASSVGRGPGRGRTLNVAWDGVGFGDADYLAAFDRALMPVARAFDPEVREERANTRSLFPSLSRARPVCVARASRSDNPPFALPGTQLVIISAGFDSSRGDPLGRCDLTPKGYAALTRELLTLANGRRVCPRARA